MKSFCNSGAAREKRYACVQECKHKKMSAFMIIILYVKKKVRYMTNSVNFIRKWGEKYLSELGSVIKQAARKISEGARRSRRNVLLKSM